MAKIAHFFGYFHKSVSGLSALSYFQLALSRHEESFMFFCEIFNGATRC